MGAACSGQSPSDGGTTPQKKQETPKAKQTSNEITIRAGDFDQQDVKILTLGAGN